VVFQLAKAALRDLFGSAPTEPPTHLAYVEWFSKFTRPEVNSGLYRVTRATEPATEQGEARRLASVIPVQDLQRSVHLLPNFGAVVPRDWDSFDVLEKCSVFRVNPFSDHHAYRNAF
jgi:hypothetical protein